MHAVRVERRHMKLLANVQCVCLASCLSRILQNIMIKSDIYEWKWHIYVGNSWAQWIASEETTNQVTLDGILSIYLIVANHVFGDSDKIFTQLCLTHARIFYGYSWYANLLMNSSGKRIDMWIKLAHRWTITCQYTFQYNIFHNDLEYKNKCYF